MIKIPSLNRVEIDRWHILRFERIILFFFDLNILAFVFSHREIIDQLIFTHLCIFMLLPVCLIYSELVQFEKGSFPPVLSLLIFWIILDDIQLHQLILLKELDDLAFVSYINLNILLELMHVYAFLDIELKQNELLMNSTFYLQPKLNFLVLFDEQSIDVF